MIRVAPVLLTRYIGTYGLLHDGTNPDSANNSMCYSSLDKLLYVADCYNHRVLVFNAISGAHVRMIGTGTPGKAAGQFQYPTAVCLSTPTAA